MVTQPYHRFTFEQRKAIQIGAAHRQKAAQIAFAPDVSPTSVSRESKRNRIPDGDGTVECKKTQRCPFVCNGCPKKHARSLAYNPTAAEQMATFRKKDPRQGVGSDEETVRAAERAIQEGFAKKKGVYKSLAAARLLGKVS